MCMSVDLMAIGKVRKEGPTGTDMNAKEMWTKRQRQI